MNLDYIDNFQRFVNREISLTDKETLRIVEKVARLPDDYMKLKFPEKWSKRRIKQEFSRWRKFNPSSLLALQVICGVTGLSTDHILLPEDENFDSLLTYEALEELRELIVNHEKDARWNHYIPVMVDSKMPTIIFLHIYEEIKKNKDTWKKNLFFQFVTFRVGSRFDLSDVHDGLNLFIERSTGGIYQINKSLNDDESKEEIKKFKKFYNDNVRRTYYIDQTLNRHIQSFYELLPGWTETLQNDFQQLIDLYPPEGIKEQPKKDLHSSIQEHEKQAKGQSNRHEFAAENR